MIGTLINFAAILIGGLIGLLAGNRIPLKVRQTLTSALGRPASRFMWADLETKTADLEAGLRDIVARVEAETTRAQMRIR